MAARFDIGRALAPAFLARLGAGLAACTPLAPGTDEAAPLETAEPRGAERAEAIEDVDVDAADAAVRSQGASWSCLEQPPAPRAVPLRPGVVLTLAVVDVASREEPEGLLARACSRLDVQCEAPLASASSGAAGRLRLALPQGFSGFIEITSASSVPALYFPSHALDGDGFEALSVISATNLDALAQTSGIALDASLGHLLARAFDCDGAEAAGVSISNGDLGTPFSFDGGLPRFGSNVTSSDGIAGYVNVAPGLVFVEGRALAEERACGAASLVVRSGWLTYGDIEPPR